MEILLANPRGFCAGVKRAIAIVERVIEKFGAPAYVRHEVVHNRFVCAALRAKGAVFIEDLSEVPTGGTVIFSAHGVPVSVRREAKERGLRVFDATCPLVTKVHLEVARMRGEGREIVMIGHKGHPEVEGTMGQSGEGMYLVETIDDALALLVCDPSRLAYVTQTTLSVDDAEKVVRALKSRFPEVDGPKKDDICYATQNRQDAVKALSENADLILVVGSVSSSNSNRLREVAELFGTRAYLIDDAAQIDPAWLEGIERVGVTAGASAPEVLVQNVVSRLSGGNPQRAVELEGIEENVTFPLPRELISEDRGQKTED
ncbi:MAG: 4-hydroxy-3-methylbut-2-enyl diphosphate reductase [Candidatus Accumulibacter sp.]|nr:4-hydroxy-3-methylbut-2-enyl diphosphate reductase [Accumulibacter sp.]